MRSYASLCVAIFGLVMLSACESNVVTKPGSFAKLQEEAKVVTNSNYKIGLGDEIEVKFFFTPELNDRVTVQPDGTISIMFADDIKAAGKTKKQLTKEIKQSLAPHVKQLDLSVSVRSFASQRVYIGGEIARAGAYPITGDQTILQMLNEAGWVAPTGRQNEIVLIRRNAEGKEEPYPLDISKVISGEDMTNNVTVLAGDTIIVPPYGAVDSNRWVERNITRMLPFSMGASASVTRTVGSNNNGQ